MASLLAILPFISFIVLNLPFKALMRKASFVVAGSLALFQAIVAGASLLRLGVADYGALGPFLPYAFSVDRLTLVALLSIGIVLFVVVLVGMVMIENEARRFNFINLLLLAFTGMNVIVMSSDLFSIYVFIEVTAISSFVLIAITKDKFAVEGAFKYIMLSAIASVLMLSSIGLLLLFAHGTSFNDLSSGLYLSGGNIIFKVCLGLFLCGLFIKAGVMPFHGWLPDAYSAACAPVSVLLAGIVTKVSGVYVLLRLSSSVLNGITYVQKPLMFLGAFSILLGAFLSLTQKDFKRLLSYSSISQVGYIILAAGCQTPLAIFGAAFHFFNHAIFKSLLFVNAAAVEKQAGTLDIDKLSGLAERMPFTGAASVVAFLSAAGMPPLAGFWSKLIIVLALFLAGKVFYGSLALLASIVTLGYFLHLQRHAFFGRQEAGSENIKEAPLGLILPQLILTAVIIVTGLAFPWLLKWR